MAGNVQAEPLKSQPDISKLNNMTARTVAVTKLTSKNGPAHMVVPPWKGVTVDQVTGLLTLVPQQHGAGTYRFEVSDESGEKDVWTVKLGANVPDLPEAPMSMLPGSVPAANGGAPGTVNPDGTRNLGHGYIFDPETGTLTTPQKQIFSWRPGEPLPGTLASAGSPSAWPAGTSWVPGQPPNWPANTPLGWGQMPAHDDHTKREIEALKEALRAAQDNQREEARRRESEDMRAALQRSIEESNKRFEALIAKISERPTGPSPETLAMQARLEAAERASAEARREAAERDRETEARRREDQLRQEMREQNERTETLIREIASKKEDPMVPLLGQIIASQQQSSAIQADAAKESARMVVERMGGSLLTPERTVELIRLAKDRGPEHEASKGLAEMYKTVFGMAQELIRAQAEINSSAAGPAWAPFAQQGIETIGRIANMYAQQKARESASSDERARVAAVAVAQQRQQQQRQQPRPQAVPQPGRTVTGGPAGLSPVPAAPAARPAQPTQPTAQQIRDAAAAQVFTEPAADSAQGIRDAAAAKVFPNKEQPGGKKRGRPPKTPESQAVAGPAPVAPVATPAAAAMPASDISQVAPEALRAVTNQIPDGELFGPALEYVVDLRAKVAGGQANEDEVTGWIFEARQQFMSFGMLPPCMELLMTGQIEILVERLLPQASAPFRASVVENVREHLDSEGQEGDDGGEGGEEAA